MAVSRKAMTEGIRTSIFPGIVNSRTFTIPQSKIKDFCQLPLHKGAFGEQIVTEGNPQGEHQRLPLLTKGSLCPHLSRQNRDG